MSEAAVQILEAILAHTALGGTLQANSPLVGMAKALHGNAPGAPAPAAAVPPAAAPPAAAPPPPPRDETVVKVDIVYSAGVSTQATTEAATRMKYEAIFASCRELATFTLEAGRCKAEAGGRKTTADFRKWWHAENEKHTARLGGARPRPHLSIVPSPAPSPPPPPVAIAADARAKPLPRDDRAQSLGVLLAQELGQLGIRTRTTFETYVAAPGTNASRLVDLAHSPLRYQHRLTVPREETAPMRLGTAAHTAILEPHKFLSEYALWDVRCDDNPDKVSPRRGAKWEAFQAANPGKKIVREDEHALAMAMRDAVRGNADAAKYLAAGDPEVAMWWADGATERICKARADWITTLDGPVLVGLKTARDCRPAPFWYAAEKLGYRIAWAFYQDGYTAITGKRPRVVEIVVESAAPHDVVVYAIPDEVLEEGREEYARLLALLGECEKTNTWPGVAVGEQVLRRPPPRYRGESSDGDDLSDLGLELT